MAFIHGNAIGRAVTVLAMLGGLIVADPARADDGWTSEQLFPLAIGNTWVYGRIITDQEDTVTLTDVRQEMVNGHLTDVLQATTGSTIIEEWNFSNNGSGIFWHKFHRFGGPTTDVTITLNPAVQITKETPALNDTVSTSGTAQIQVSGSTMTAPYTASSFVDEFGTVRATPGALRVGVRTITDFALSGTPPANGTASADIFFGQNTGPMKMNLFGFGFNEEKSLKFTNVGPRNTVISSAVLPTNLATTVNSTVTAFAAIANGGTADATGCGFAALPLEGDQTPGNFVYAQTDPTTNQVFGPANPLVTVPAGSFKTFVFALQPTLAYGFKNIQFVYDCANTAPASWIQGVNTFGLFASTSPPSNILMVNATPDNDGFCHIQGTNGFCAFSVAATNLGVGGPITVSGAPLNPGTSVIVTTCETKPDGTCLQSPTPQVMVPQWDQNQNRTFSVFVQGTDNVFSDPATNRVNVKANDQQGNQVGGTGVATDTKVPPGTHTLLVTVSGQNGTAGTVKIDPPGKILTFPDPTNPQNTVSGFEFYDTPTTVTLTATVTTGSSATFGGDCSGNGPSCTVTVGPSDRSVTVTFNK